MATETGHGGTLRTDYEADRARLDDLRPLTADTAMLFEAALGVPANSVLGFIEKQDAIIRRLEDFR